MKAIVVVDRNWAIGNKNGLLFHVKEDLEHFKRMTIGRVIILGRKTLETFPGGKPLPGRLNCVLSSDPDFKVEGSPEEVRVFDSIGSVLAEFRDDPNVFVVGGASVYEQMLSYCDTVYVTKIPDTAPEADAYFPDMDKFHGWEMVDQEYISTEKYGFVPVSVYKWRL